MKEEYNLLQTYEIFLKLIYLKLLQGNLNNEIIGFIDKGTFVLDVAVIFGGRIEINWGKRDEK